MALQTSGQISLGDVRGELDSSGQISLGSSNVRELFGISSGEIQMSDGYGATSGTPIFLAHSSSGGTSTSNMEFLGGTIESPQHLATAPDTAFSIGAARVDPDDQLLFYINNDRDGIVKVDYSDINNLVSTNFSIDVVKLSINTTYRRLYALDGGDITIFDYNFNVIKSISTGYPGIAADLTYTEDAFIYQEIFGTTITELDADGNFVKDVNSGSDFGVFAESRDLRYDSVNDKLVGFEGAGSLFDPFVVYNWSLGASGSVSVVDYQSFNDTGQGSFILFPEVQKLIFAGLDTYSLIDYSGPLVREDTISRLGIRTGSTRIGNTNIIAAMDRTQERIDFIELDGNNINLISSYDGSGVGGATNGDVVYLE